MLIIISTVQDAHFKVGNYLFINHSGIENGSTMTQRQYWICFVLEIKAADAQHVYVRVFWLYWPEDLPGGRKSYHGKSELIMSNHMEIIDAQTVTAAATVTQWDEFKDEDDGEPMSALYWRHWYNFMTKKLSVSSLEHRIFLTMPLLTQ